MSGQAARTAAPRPAPGAKHVPGPANLKERVAQLRVLLHEKSLRTQELERELAKAHASEEALERKFRQRRLEAGDNKGVDESVSRAAARDEVLRLEEALGRERQRFKRAKLKFERELEDLALDLEVREAEVDVKEDIIARLRAQLSAFDTRSNDDTISAQPTRKRDKSPDGPGFTELELSDETEGGSPLRRRGSPASTASLRRQDRLRDNTRANAGDSPERRKRGASAGPGEDDEEEAVKAGWGAYREDSPQRSALRAASPEGRNTTTTPSGRTAPREDRATSPVWQERGTSPMRRAGEEEQAMPYPATRKPKDEARSSGRGGPNDDHFSPPKPTTLPARQVDGRASDYDRDPRTKGRDQHPATRGNGPADYDDARDPSRERGGGRHGNPRDDRYDDGRNDRDRYYPSRGGRDRSPDGRSPGDWRSPGREGHSTGGRTGGTEGSGPPPSYYSNPNASPAQQGTRAGGTWGPPQTMTPPRDARSPSGGVTFSPGTPANNASGVYSPGGNRTNTTANNASGVYSPGVYSPGGRPQNGVVSSPATTASPRKRVPAKTKVKPTGLIAMAMMCGTGVALDVVKVPSGGTVEARKAAARHRGSAPRGNTRTRNYGPQPAAMRSPSPTSGPSGGTEKSGAYSPRGGPPHSASAFDNSIGRPVGSPQQGGQTPQQQQQQQTRPANPNSAGRPPLAPGHGVGQQAASPRAYEQQYGHPPSGHHHHHHHHHHAHPDRSGHHHHDGRHPHDAHSYSYSDYSQDRHAPRRPRTRSDSTGGGDGRRDGRRDDRGGRSPRRTRSPDRTRDQWDDHGPVLDDGDARRIRESEPPRGAGDQRPGSRAGGDGARDQNDDRGRPRDGGGRTDDGGYASPHQHPSDPRQYATSTDPRFASRDRSESRSPTRYAEDGTRVTRNESPDGRRKVHVRRRSRHRHKHGERSEPGTYPRVERVPAERDEGPGVTSGGTSGPASGDPYGRPPSGRRDGPDGRWDGPDGRPQPDGRWDGPNSRSGPDGRWGGPDGRPGGSDGRPDGRRDGPNDRPGPDGRWDGPDASRPPREGERRQSPYRSRASYGGLDEGPPVGSYSPGRDGGADRRPASPRRSENGPYPSSDRVPENGPASSRNYRPPSRAAEPDRPWDARAPSPYRGGATPPSHKGDRRDRRDSLDGDSAYGPGGEGVRSESVTGRSRRRAMSPRSMRSMSPVLVVQATPDKPRDPLNVTVSDTNLCGVAVMDYDGSNAGPDALRFRKGDVVTHIEQDPRNKAWSTGTSNGHRGRFPSHLIQLIDSGTASKIVELRATMGGDSDSEMADGPAATTARLAALAAEQRGAGADPAQQPILVLASPATRATGAATAGTVTGTALYDYDGKGAGPTGLVFRAGDRIRDIIPGREGQWSFGSAHGRSGPFPTSYVELADTTAALAVSALPQMLVIAPGAGPGARSHKGHSEPPDRLSRAGSPTRGIDEDKLGRRRSRSRRRGSRSPSRSPARRHRSRSRGNKHESPQRDQGQRVSPHPSSSRPWRDADSDSLGRRRPEERHASTDGRNVPSSEPRDTRRRADETRSPPAPFDRAAPSQQPRMKAEYPADEAPRRRDDARPPSPRAGSGQPLRPADTAARSDASTTYSQRATGVALYDFDGSGAGDKALRLRAGQRVTNIRVTGAPWMFGVADGKAGVFPTAYVRLDPPSVVDDERAGKPADKPGQLRKDTVDRKVDQLFAEYERRNSPERRSPERNGSPGRERAKESRDDSVPRREARRDDSPPRREERPQGDDRPQRDEGPRREEWAQRDDGSRDERQNGLPPLRDERARGEERQRRVSPSPPRRDDRRDDSPPRREERRGRSPVRRPEQRREGSAEKPKSASPKRRIEGVRGVALFDFSLPTPGTLKFKAGDVVHKIVLSQTDGWSYGFINGMSGSFPTSYVRTDAPAPALGPPPAPPRTTPVPAPVTTSPRPSQRTAEASPAGRPDAPTRPEVAPRTAPQPAPRRDLPTSGGSRAASPSGRAGSPSRAARGVALFDFASDAPGTLRLRGGDLVEHIFDSAVPGWSYGRVGTSTGSFPTSCVRVETAPDAAGVGGFRIAPMPSGELRAEALRALNTGPLLRGVALFDFVSDAPGALRLRRGDVLDKIIPSEVPGWSYGRTGNSAGSFPTSYVDTSSAAIATLGASPALTDARAPRQPSPARDPYAPGNRAPSPASSNVAPRRPSPRPRSPPLPQGAVAAANAMSPMRPPSPRQPQTLLPAPALNPLSAPSSAPRDSRPSPAPSRPAQLVDDRRSLRAEDRLSPVDLPISDRLRSNSPPLVADAHHADAVESAHASSNVPMPVKPPTLGGAGAELAIRVGPGGMTQPDEGAVGVCLFEFPSAEEALNASADLLSIRAGDRITNVVQRERGWCEGRIGARRGVFPAGYVRVMAAAEMDPAPVARPDPTRATLDSGPSGVVLFDFFRAFDGGPEQQILAVGDRVTNIKVAERGWSQGMVSGRPVVFPTTYVEFK